VPEAAILIDEGGTRTYESCARARDVFGIQQALLVTQRFHLPRALALCDSLGLEAWGVVADLHAYSAPSRLLWELREIPASLVALWETHTGRPVVTNLVTVERALDAEGSPRDA
jgi:vancomycin permeability regulator SanA